MLNLIVYYLIEALQLILWIIFITNFLIFNKYEIVVLIIYLECCINLLMYKISLNYKCYVRFYEIHKVKIKKNLVKWFMPDEYKIRIIK